MRRESRNQVEGQDLPDNRDTLTEAGADINLGSESGLRPSLSTRWTPLAHAVALLFLVLRMFLPTAALADEVTGDFKIVTDTKSDFKAIGSLQSTDTDLPPNGIQIATDVISGDFWDFVIWNRVTDWRFGTIPPTSDNGADNATVSIHGLHKDGPHPPPDGVEDIDPNDLPPITSTAHDITFGRDAMLSRADRKKHPVVGGKFHWDHYAVRHKATPMQGPPHLLTGPAEVVAKHGEQGEVTLPAGITVGSSMNSGTTVAYDAASGRLSFSLGATDIVNASGSLAAGVDSTYQSDPVVGAPLVLPDLYYQGVDSTGQYVFTGGGIELFAPNQERRFEGAFAEYRISSTTGPDTLESFALLDSLTILDAGDCPSAFLRDFVAVHMIGDAIPREEWLALEGIGFTFVTPVELWQVTQGFTQSISGMQATVAVCGNASVGNPSSVASPHVGNGAVHLVAVVPNPFRTGADVRYELPSASPVRIDVFNAAGQRVRTLVDLGSQPAGKHSVVWDGTDERGEKAPPGVYFSRLSTGSITQRARMVLVR